MSAVDSIISEYHNLLSYTHQQSLPDAQDDLLSLINQISDTFTDIKRKLESLETNLIIHFTGITMSSQKAQEISVLKLEMDKCVQRMTKENSEDVMLTNDLAKMIKKYKNLIRTQNQTIRKSSYKDFSGFLHSIGTKMDALIEEYKLAGDSSCIQEISMKEEATEQIIENRQGQYMRGLSIPSSSQTYFFEKSYNNCKLWNIDTGRCIANLSQIQTGTINLHIQQDYFYLKNQGYIAQLCSKNRDLKVIFYKLSSKCMRRILQIPFSTDGVKQDPNTCGLAILEPECIFAISNGSVLKFINMRTKKVIREKHFRDEGEITRMRYIKKQRLLLILLSRNEAEISVYFVTNNMDLSELKYSIPNYLSDSSLVSSTSFMGNVMINFYSEGSDLRFDVFKFNFKGAFKESTLKLTAQGLGVENLEIEISIIKIQVSEQRFTIRYYNFVDDDDNSSYEEFYDDEINFYGSSREEIIGFRDSRFLVE